ncbi:hypothetical protein ACROYT_G001904 [Oculina patagonica]
MKNLKARRRSSELASNTGRSLPMMTEGKIVPNNDESIDERIEIGDRKGEPIDYGNLGIVFQSLGEYDKAKEYLEKALAIRVKIGDREGEAADYGNLGTVFQSPGEYVKAKEYHEKALKIRIEIGDKQ